MALSYRNHYDLTRQGRIARMVADIAISARYHDIPVAVTSEIAPDARRIVQSVASALRYAVVPVEVGMHDVESLRNGTAAERLRQIIDNLDNPLLLLITTKASEEQIEAIVRSTEMHLSGRGAILALSDDPDPVIAAIAKGLDGDGSKFIQF